jgi:hypothetical protein
VIVTVPELVVAVAAAVSVIVAIAPGAIITDAGLAVTPAGNPEIASAICVLYPFTAVDVTVICCVAPPAVSATLAGVTATAKSPTIFALDPHPPNINRMQPNITKPGAHHQRPTAAQPLFQLSSIARVVTSIRLPPS